MFPAPYASLQLCLEIFIALLGLDEVPRGVEYLPTAFPAYSLSHPDRGNPLLSLDNGAAAMLGVAGVHDTVFAFVEEERGCMLDGFDKHIRVTECRASTDLWNLAV